MNKKGFGMIGAVVGGAVIISTIVSASFNWNFVKTEDGTQSKNVSLTELTKKNGQTIWCKMQGKKGCDNR